MSTIAPPEVKKAANLVEITITKVAPSLFDLLQAIAVCLKDKLGQEQTGEQSLKALARHDDKFDSIPINSESLKGFKTVAKKHNVTYAIVPDDTKAPPQCKVYFKASDTQAFTAVFKEYLASEIKQAQSKTPTFRERMADAKEKVAAQEVKQDKDKDRDKKQERQER